MSQYSPTKLYDKIIVPIMTVKVLIIDMITIIILIIQLINMILWNRILSPIISIYVKYLQPTLYDSDIIYNNNSSYYYSSQHQGDQGIMNNDDGKCYRHEGLSSQIVPICPIGNTTRYISSLLSPVITINEKEIRDNNINRDERIECNYLNNSANNDIINNNTVVCPPFHSLRDACSFAIRHDRLLVVYLHCETNLRSVKLLDEIILNDSYKIQSYLRGGTPPSQESSLYKNSINNNNNNNNNNNTSSSNTPVLGTRGDNNNSNNRQFTNNNKNITTNNTNTEPAVAAFYIMSCFSCEAASLIGCQMQAFPAILVYSTPHNNNNINNNNSSSSSFESTRPPSMSQTTPPFISSSSVSPRDAARLAAIRRMTQNKEEKEIEIYMSKYLCQNNNNNNNNNNQKDNDAGTTERCGGMRFVGSIEGISSVRDLKGFISECDKLYGNTWTQR